MIPGALLALALPAAAASWPQIPRLPAIVQLETDGSSFCDSENLLWALNRHGFQRVLRASERPPYDFIISCFADDGKAAIELLEPNRSRVRGLKVTMGGNEQKTAVVVARELATQDKVVAAVLARSLDRSAYQHGLPADEAFKRGDWPAVVSELQDSVESSIPEGVFYFSLYAANAKLGAAEKAKWYLACFAKATGTRFKDLTAEQLSFLREMIPAAPEGHERAVALQQDLARATLAKDWPQTIRLTKELAAVEPWFLPAYESQSKTYGTLDWDAYETYWKRREKIAQAVSRDEDLHDAIERALRVP